MARRVPGVGEPGPEWPGEPGHGQGYGGDQGAQRYGYDGAGSGPSGQDPFGQDPFGQDPFGQDPFGQHGGPGYDQPNGYGQPPAYGGRGGAGYPPQGNGQQGNGQQASDQRGYGQQQGYRAQGYAGADAEATRAFTVQRAGAGYADGPPNGNMRRYEDPRGSGDPARYAPGGYGGYGGPPPGVEQDFPAPGRGRDAPALNGNSPANGDPRDGRPPRKVRFRRTRRLFRRRSVRVISVIVALCLVWLMFSVGQAAVKNNGQGMAANIAEWARDHKLGPIVTFGEWLSYNPPPKGGKPSFSLAVPSGEAVGSGKAKGKTGFQPDVPATLKSLAGSSIAGEGQWRVVEKVKGQPAILTTFLRDATYTSQVNGIASIDQRLVKFSLRPGTEDPGPAKWGVPNYIPAGQRTGLLATFNGGFKLDSAGGGFYLNGVYHGSLVKGAASVVYYKDGTVKVGEWGRDFTMNSKIEGVRQNLKLLVDHGKVSPDADSNVVSNWGATLSGGYYVWRSGIGVTKDGRVVYVYGSALNAEDLGKLLQRAGAVEGMQMDINPAWMKFDYYQAKGKPADPTPVPLLPTQQPSPYSYYTPSTRDFTAVYSR